VARATPTQWHPPPTRIGPFLEVPDQRDEVRWERIAHEAVERPARIRSPIHVVAERDGRAVAGGARVEVASNVLDHPVEQGPSGHECRRSRKFSPYRERAVAKL
jgi:hypothetical protein